MRKFKSRLVYHWYVVLVICLMISGIISSKAECVHTLTESQASIEWTIALRRSSAEPARISTEESFKLTTTDTSTTSQRDSNTLFSGSQGESTLSKRKNNDVETSRSSSEVKTNFSIKISMGNSVPNTRDTVSPLELKEGTIEAGNGTESTVLSSKNDVDSFTVASEVTTDFGVKKNSKGNPLATARDTASKTGNGPKPTVLLPKGGHKGELTTVKPRVSIDKDPKTTKVITTTPPPSAQNSSIHIKNTTTHGGNDDQLTSPKTTQTNLSYITYLDVNETEANQLVKLVLLANGRKSKWDDPIVTSKNHSALFKVAAVKTSLVGEWAASVDWDEEANAMGLHLSANTVLGEKAGTPLHIIVLLSMVTLILFSLVTVSVLWRTRDYRHISRNLLPLRHLDRIRRY